MVYKGGSRISSTILSNDTRTNSDEIIGANKCNASEAEEDDEDAYATTRSTSPDSGGVVCCYGCGGYKKQTRKQQQQQQQQDQKLRNSSSFWNLCAARQRVYQLRLTGPSMGGKTSFLRYLTHRQFVETDPTKNMEVSRLYWRDIPFIFWDSRKYGEDDTKPAVLTATNILADLSQKTPVISLHSMDALVYVVDGADRGRLRIACRDLNRLLKAYHRVPVLLILATKCDRPDVLEKDEIKSQLKLLECAFDRECAVFMVSNITGEGIEEAMEWLYERIRPSAGFWASFYRHLSFSDDRLGNPRLTFPGWDPFVLCRYSRLP